VLAAITEEERSFRRAVRAWLIENVPAPNVDFTSGGRRKYALEWQRRQFIAGWAGVSWPAEYGGRGLSDQEQIIWYEEYARAGAPSSLGPSFVAINHAAPTLIALGTPAQRAFHLPRILSGESLWCQGFSEPGAGSDLAGLQVRARIEGHQMIVRGQKLWCSYADLADYQELLVRTDPASERHNGLTWVICDMRTPGITIRPIRNITGVADFAEVFYDDVRIPLDNVVGQIDQGWKVAMATLGYERGTASIALQIEMQQALEALIQSYDCAVREGFACVGTEARLATLWAQTSALRALTFETISGAAGGKPVVFDSSMIRLRFAELMQEIHRMGFELSGARGLEMRFAGDWTESYLHSLHETIAGGTSEIQRNIIAERLLGLPRDR
jgi:alkylation response protein AidB-like acyl-CoA dehydrogenase